ncbi:hypothetical protein DH2020_046342 [Rehmannia glutinosa]|uniref:Uncharacterized protein n=1 Tax=Rehmannia glutinosa TaxID=99300 RepID=A0ABR0UBK1_REHGL
MRIAVHLFNRNALVMIAKLIGQPLRIDKQTLDCTKLFVARLYVGIDVSLPKQESIFLRFNSELRPPKKSSGEIIPPTSSTPSKEAPISPRVSPLKGKQNDNAQQHTDDVPIEDINQFDALTSNLQIGENEGSNLLTSSKVEHIQIIPSEVAFPLPPEIMNHNSESPSHISEIIVPNITLTEPSSTISKADLHPSVVGHMDKTPSYHHEASSSKALTSPTKDLIPPDLSDPEELFSIKL